MLGNVTLDEPDPLQVYIAPFGRRAREKRRETQDTPSTCELFIKVERRQRVDKVAAAAHHTMATWQTTKKIGPQYSHFPQMALVGPKGSGISCRWATFFLAMNTACVGPCARTMVLGQRDSVAVSCCNAAITVSVEDSWELP